MTDRSLPLDDGTIVELTDDPTRVDRDTLWAFLTAEDTYWHRWRSRHDVEQQLAASWRVVSAHINGSMVAFARAISDGVSLAYLADVYVDPSFRGRGLGKELVRLMIDDGPGARFRWMLHTRDAHDLYRSFGFTEPGATYLERANRFG